MSSDEPSTAKAIWSANDYGRDHHPRCFSPPGWPAAASRVGCTYGKTDDFSYNIVQNPVAVRDLHATMLHQLGINHERLTFPVPGTRSTIDRRRRSACHQRDSWLASLLRVKSLASSRRISPCVRRGELSCWLRFAARIGHENSVGTARAPGDELEPFGRTCLAGTACKRVNTRWLHLGRVMHPHLAWLLYPWAQKYPNLESAGGTADEA